MGTGNSETLNLLKNIKCSQLVTELIQWSCMAKTLHNRYINFEENEETWREIQARPRKIIGKNKIRKHKKESYLRANNTSLFRLSSSQKL